MKRCMLFFAAIATMGLASGLRAADMKQERMNLNIWGSGFSSVSGDFGPGVKSTDFLQTGQGFGIAWQYFPMHTIGVQAAYDFGWQNVADQYRSEAGKTPAFAVHQITLAGLYNFANLLSNSRFRPSIGAGIGLYPFRLTQDGPTGDAQKLANGNELSKTSFGLNGNASVEFLATDHLGIIGSARYNYIFAEDNNKFGADANFSDQAMLSYGLGLSYHFGGGH